MAKVYDNSGSIAANKDRKKDTHPNIRGKATIGGVDYWIDGWQKQGQNGLWYSLSFKVREAKQEPAPEPESKAADELSDDIPF
jgi:hypothetical protein